MEGSGDPTTRVTVGKEVADDVLVIVSNDFGGPQRQIYVVEWQASPRWRVRAGGGQLGGIGGDIEFTDRFWWRRPKEEREAAEVARVDTRPPAEPRPTVAAVRIEGVEEEQVDKLRRLIPLDVGAEFRRSLMFEGVEALRRHHVRAGRIRADVRGSVVESADHPGAMEIVYTVTPGPAITVRFSGTKRKDERRLRRALEEFWTESLFGEDLFEDSVPLIREYFWRRGYYAVDVEVKQRSDMGKLELLFDVDPGKPVTIEAVVLEGSESASGERIRRQMLTRPSTLLSRQLLKPEILQADIAAIRNLYRDLGFLTVRVPPPRIRLSSNGETAQVHLVIEEGPRFSISDLEFPPDGPFDVEVLRAWSGLAVGQVFSPSRLLAAEGALRDGIDEQGYPDATVRGRVSRGQDSAGIHFEIVPGERKRVGAIEISGNRLTQDRIILRELELKPGELISRDKLLRTQHRLYRLGIFRNVSVGYTQAEDGSDGQRLKVDVREAKPLRLTVGAGYSSEGTASGLFALTDENVAGRDLVVSFQGAISSLLERLNLLGRSPRLFGAKFPVLANISWEKEEEVGFSAETRSAAIRVDRELGPRWDAYLRYNFQRVEVKEVTDPNQSESRDNLGNIGFAVVRDTRDDPFLTTSGTLFSAGASVFSKLLISDQFFFKAGARAAVFQKVGRDLSFGTSLRLAVSEPFGETERVPISERFFAGGDSTLRGFERNEVGPQVAGEPIGGEVRLLFNQEFRFPVWSRLKGVVFYDAGNVYATTPDFDPGDLRHVLGAGLRLETPIGPLRLEYGHKVDREDGESAGELFIAVGAAF